MSESSYGPDADQTAGATVEGEGGVTDSAAADQAAAHDDPVSSQSGMVSGDDAVVASPGESAVDETVIDTDNDSSHNADVAAGSDGSS